MNREQALHILELSDSATDSEIRAAYRDLVKIWHPDRFAHDPKLQTKAQEKLKEIIQAYEVLFAPPSEEIAGAESARKSQTSAASETSPKGQQSATSQDNSGRTPHGILWIAYFCLGFVVLLTVAMILFRSLKSEAPTLNSFEYHRLLAEQGDKIAQDNLGYMYSQGQGVAKDFSKAIHWWKLAAERGSVYAQNSLGQLFASGVEGVVQDYAEAARWYRMSAEQGDATGQLNLGSLYFQGKGLPQDYAESLRWIRKSADQGNSRSQALIGAAYNTGNVLPRDFTEAHFWLNLAAAGSTGEDNKQFAELRDSVEKRLSAQQLSDVQRRAREWRPKPNASR